MRIFDKFFNHSSSSLPTQSPKYVLEDEVGHGSTGKVVIVRRLKDGRRFARKTIPITSDEVDEHVKNEWTILQKLEHRHIVRYSHREKEARSNGIPLIRIYMEYCEGGDLHYHIQGQKKKIRDGRQLASQSVTILGTQTTSRRSEVEKGLQGGPEQPEHLIWHTLVQIASALAYCHHNVPYTDRDMSLDATMLHSERVCHRDLTPSNVFLVTSPISDELQIKVGDFGLAVDLRGGPAMTWTGTGDFTAPEIAMGNNNVRWTVKADIYSLGCILYYMCTGNAPDTLYSQDPRFIESTISSAHFRYSNSLSQTIIACSRKTPAERPNACQIHNIARSCYQKAAKGDVDGLSKTILALEELQKSQYLVFQRQDTLNVQKEHSSVVVGSNVVFQGNIRSDEFY